MKWDKARGQLPEKRQNEDRDHEHNRECMQGMKDTKEYHETITEVASGARRVQAWRRPL